MKQQAFDEELMRRYLLGDLGADELQQLEARMVSDEEFFEDYLASEDRVEEELIDEYVGGDLPENKRGQFESIFLSTPERVQKLRIAQTLQDFANAPPLPAHAAAAHAQKTPVANVAAANVAASGSVPASGWGQWLPGFFHMRSPLAGLALALAVLLAGVVALSLFVKSRRLEGELNDLRAREQQQSPQPQNQPPPMPQSQQEELSQLRARNEELAAELRRAEDERARAQQLLASQIQRANQETQARDAAVGKPQTAQPVVVTLALALGRSRSEGAGAASDLKLPDRATGARLLLGLDTIDPSDYQSFQAVVTRRDGTAVLTRSGLKATRGDGESRVPLTLPAARLADGEYIIRLSGASGGGQVSLIGVYDFRVTRN